MRLGVLAVIACSLAGCQLVFTLDDNCATDGHDEDCDGIVDDVDNCPTTPNADQANEVETLAGATPDSVGDACDPNAATTGDRVVVFESFAGANDQARWTELSGDWEFDGDTVRVSSPEGRARLRYILPQPTPPMRVEYTVVIDDDFDAVTPETVDAFQVRLEEIDEDPMELTCGIARLSTGGVLIGDHVLTTYTRQANNGSALPIEPPRAGDRYLVTTDYDATKIRCSAEHEAMTQTSGLDFSVVPPPGSLAFAIQFASAHVESLVVYKVD